MKYEDNSNNNDSDDKANLRPMIPTMGTTPTALRIVATTKVMIVMTEGQDRQG